MPTQLNPVYETGVCSRSGRFASSYELKEVDIEEKPRRRIACHGVAGLAIVCDGGVNGGGSATSRCIGERIVCGVFT